jgi:hypothetical protein
MYNIQYLLGLSSNNKTKLHPLVTNGNFTIPNEAPAVKDQVLTVLLDLLGTQCPKTKKS